jgi:hypothetical protein
LNIETGGVEFRPWPVENWTGPWNFDHKPGSKFNMQHKNTEYLRLRLFSQKLVLHFGFYPSIYFILLLIYYVIKSHWVLTLRSLSRVLSSGLLIYKQCKRVCICFSSVM